MKCRILVLHKEVNQGKVARLEALHAEYVSYVRICVQAMLDASRLTLPKSEKQAFFPRAEHLTSQIEKNARDHAIDMVSTWAKGVYARKMKSTITNLRREGSITEEDAKAFYVIGSRLIDRPWKFITQGHLDAYRAMLDAYGGNPPCVKPSLPMRLSEMTARLEDPDEATTADFWLRVSSLEARQSIWLPLVGSPYVQHAVQVGKGISARKTKLGRWRFEVVDKSAWEPPVLSQDAPKLGVDVGLNVLATTSDGCLYGEAVKPRFDNLYARLMRLRGNRQRQGLRENSRRLDIMESGLSGFVKTETGCIVNRLVKRHPGTVFVIEDLDLSGCKGQKRFAYRALSAHLERKAVVQKVNPAYTSQECPSCGYVSRSNRSGVKFTCRSCGRKAHADWVGASGILRRSEDKGIRCADHPRAVKPVLRQRYNLRRRGHSSSGPVPTTAPPPLGLSLTTGGSGFLDTGTGSNSGAARASSRF